MVHDRRHCRLRAAQILRAAVEMQMEEIAHCFMPDHLHLIVEGCTETAHCLAFVHRAKQRSGYAFGRRWQGRLWQPSFYDRVLRDEESTLPFIKYILENPIRGGLVTSVEEYPFLGSARYTVAEVLDCTQPCSAAL
jgi:REP element-mobilizing transposase RayT